MITKEMLCKLAEAPLEELCREADRLREKMCGNAFDLCTIVNGKSGRCSEDCRFCAQSSCHRTDIEEYPLMEKEKIRREAAYNQNKGVVRFSVVTSGRHLTDREVEQLCQTYEEISRSQTISLCASHGLLTKDQFHRLKAAGVSRYHNNLEASSKFFSQICTTHTQEDKRKAIWLAREAGLSVCSGGIIGMGETMEDRIDLALELRQLDVRSVPINILSPIPGTPLADQKPLTAEEVCRTVALFRFALPNASIRLAGGRGLLPDKGRKAFCSGANAAISGDMLTTAGINIETDLKMIEELGYKVVKCNDERFVCHSYGNRCGEDLHNRVDPEKNETGRARSRIL